MTTAQVDIDEQNAIAKIRQEKENERKYNYAVKALRHSVEQAEQRITRAEDFKQFCETRTRELQQIQAQLIGIEQSVVNVSPITSLLDAYLSIASLRAAILDFPRLKAVLQDNLATARKHLAEFIRANG